MAKARPKNKAESIAGYFNKLFVEKPHWLKAKRNDAILERYRKDHNLNPDDPLSPSIRQGLSNAKSLRRKKLRLGKDDRKATEQVGDNHLPALGTLEEQIDECMMLAKTLNRETLAEVIHWLRRARNEVVRQAGQAD